MHATTRDSRPKIPEPDLQQVDAWLDDILRQDRRSAAEALLALLRDYTASPRLDGMQRVRLADYMRPHVVDLVESTLAGGVDRSLPYTPDIEIAWRTAARLHAQLARFYQSALERLSDRQPTANGDTAATRAQIARSALTQFGQARLTYALLYRGPEPGFWRDVYRTLRLIHAHERDDAEASASPVAEFKRLALFELLGPNRLRQSEMRQVFRMLSRVTDRVTLDERPAVGSRVAAYVYDMNIDQGPDHAPPVGETDGTSRRYIYTETVAELLERNPGDDATRSPGHVSPALAAMLRRIARSLGAPPKRTSRRLREFGECRLAVGIEDIRIALREMSVGRGSTPGLDVGQDTRVAWLALADMALAPPGPGTNHSSRGGRNESAIVNQFDGVSGAGRTMSANGRARVSQRQGRLLNSSAGGYCVAWLEQQSAAVRVGELLGIPLDKAGMQMGVVRWISAATPQLELGIELLSPTIEAIEVLGGLTTIHGLMLPPLPPIRNTSELLLAPGHGREGMRITIQTSRMTRAMRLAELREATPSFERYVLLEDR